MYAMYTYCEFSEIELQHLAFECECKMVQATWFLQDTGRTNEKNIRVYISIKLFFFFRLQNKAIFVNHL